MPATRHFTVAALFGLAFAHVACAAAASRGDSCTGIADDVQRLACYDQAFGRAVTTARGAPATAPDAGSTAHSTTATVTPPVAVPPEQARAEFGLSEQEKRARAADPDAPKPVESIVAKVAQVTRRPTGEQVFVMEDGQTWMEQEAFARTRVRAGDEVTIRKGSLGSFMLVTPAHVATHVRRVK